MNPFAPISLDTFGGWITLLDPSDVPPGMSPNADVSAAGNISAGVHQASVDFETRQGFWTAPSPPVGWTAAGGKQATLIPTGPANIVQRLLCFPGAGGADLIQVPATMTINGNSATTFTLDFNDTILLSGVSTD